MKRHRKSAIFLFSAVGIGALAIGELHAQGAPTVAVAAQPSGDDTFTRPSWCLNSASAICRRKPRSPSPLDFNIDFETRFGTPAPEGGSLRMHGNTAVLRLEAHHVRIKTIIAELGAALGFSYKSSIALDDPIDGTYSGSLRYVLSRVLDGYDYVIKHENSHIEVIIVEKSGVRAVAAVAVLVNPYHPLRERRRATLLRTD
jgi:hypothetical protein